MADDESDSTTEIPRTPTSTSIKSSLELSFEAISGGILSPTGTAILPTTGWRTSNYKHTTQGTTFDLSTSGERMNDSMRYLLELSEKGAQYLVDREKEERLKVFDLEMDLETAKEELNRTVQGKDRIVSRIKRLRASLDMDPESEKTDEKYRVEHECGVGCDYDCYLF